MFAGQDVVTSIDKWTVDTSTVTTMYNMFEYCSKLTALDVSNFDTSKVTNMDYMFDYCSNLTALDVSKWDLSNVTRMNKIFDHCQNLKILTAAPNEKLAAALPGSGWTYSDGAYRRP